MISVAHMHPFYTIGHSTRSIVEFMDMLRSVQVTLVADVRTVPRSRTNPQYNRQSLPHTLRQLHDLEVWQQPRQLLWTERSQKAICRMNGLGHAALLPLGRERGRVSQPPASDVILASDTTLYMRFARCEQSAKDGERDQYVPDVPDERAPPKRG
jgi:Protein of unknown function, DUF488